MIISIRKISVSEEFRFNTVLLHPEKQLLFAGTSHGMVQVWDVDMFTKKAELRYLLVNRYGEQEPVIDPVMGLAAPNQFDVVYAFMGNYAYCIDVELLVIIEKIPISERVLAGNVAPNSGEIGVITEMGYISRWAAHFVVRVGHLVLPYKSESAYVIHDWSEERVIIILRNNRLILANLEGDTYTIEFNHPQASQLLDGIWFDSNRRCAIMIDFDGSINVFNKSNINHERLKSHILSGGKLRAENIIRSFVTDQDTSENQRKYVQDIRMGRQSRDRYDAEIEHLSEPESKIKTSIEGDSHTVHYAMQDVVADDIKTKTTAYSVIEKLAQRHELDPRYIFFSYRIGVKAGLLLEISRGFEFEAMRRNAILRRIIPLALLLSILSLILSDLYISSGFYGFRYYLIPLLVNVLIIIYWQAVNGNPKLPGVSEYKGLRVFVSITLLLSIAYELIVRLLPSIGIPL